MSQVTLTMQDKPKVSWADRRREHFTAVIATIFSLGSAAVAYCASLLTNDKAKFGGTATSLFLWTIAMFAGSLIAGVATMISRLEDFRATARVVHLSSSRSEEDREMKASLRKRASLLGSCTYFFFYLQIALFTVGVALLVCDLWYLFHEKLYPN